MNSQFLYIIFNTFVKVVGLNLLWLLFNLPLTYFFVHIVFVTNVEQFLSFIIPVIICLPIFLFPATTAMFCVVRLWVLEKNIHKQPITRLYWKFYKLNYKQSFLGRLIITCLWVIVCVDIYFFAHTQYIALVYLFIIIGFILFLIMINYFSVIAHFKRHCFESLKMASLITVSSPSIFFIVFFTSIPIFIISIFYFNFLFVFGGISMISYVSFYAFHRFYINVVEKNVVN